MLGYEFRSKQLAQKARFTKSKQFSFGPTHDQDYKLTAKTDIEGWWNGLADMMDDIATSDFTISVGSRRIAVHKVLLSVHSPVFKAMINNDMLESDMNEVMITDFSEEVVLSMLNCIYDPSKIEAELDSFPVELFEIVHMYEITSLLVLTESRLRSSITTSNAFEMLQFAHKHCNMSLKTAAMNVILQNKALLASSNTPNVTEMLGTTLMNDLLAYLVANYNLVENKSASGHATKN